MAKSPKVAAKKLAWKYFSLYIRHKYKDQNGLITCYTCGKQGKPEGDRFQAGHWVAGHSNATYLVEAYVRPQCYSCNMGKGGMQGEFRDKIRQELGNEKVDELLLRAKNPVELTTDDYLQLVDAFKNKYLNLSKKQTP